MSISDLVRRPKAPAEPGIARPASREARVSLLPPELRAADGVRAIRRRLIGGVVASAVVVAAGITVTAGVELTSQVHLLVVSSRTTDLVHQVARYQAISQLQARIALVKQAERVGSSPAIDWKSYLNRVKAVTPPSFTVTGIAVDSASATIAYDQGTSAVDAPRVGTIAVTATADSLDDLPAWLTGLATLPGYADALPQTTSDPNSTTGGYSVVVTMHVTDGAYATPITQGVAK